MLKEKDSLQDKLEWISKENEFLKKDNISLTSKLNEICEEILLAQRPSTLVLMMINS